MGRVDNTAEGAAIENAFDMQQLVAREYGEVSKLPSQN
jgi:hypothetical protein